MITPLKGMLRALALSLLLVPALALAETYRVDLIVFQNLSAAGEAGVAAQAQELRGALEPSNGAALKAQGIEILPDDQFGLTDQWQHLRYSKAFRPIVKLAWTQKDPPGERGPSIRIKGGTALTVGEAASPINEIDGTVALLLGRYLHLDADLSYSQASSTDALASYRLDERRRLKRDEVHHLDSPKLGILVRVTKPSVP